MRMGGATGMRLTGVWTIFILCHLIFLMVPAMSTSPSFSICSSTVSIAIRVPIRPTPALWGQNDTMTPLHTYTIPPPSLHSPAVYQDRSFAFIMLGLDLPMEGQEGGGLLWYPMVRPASEVELGHLPCC